MTQPDLKASGVKELIDRIRDEGVHSARTEADRILAEAKAKAARTVAEAKAKAAVIEKDARVATERERTASIEALRIAARDTGLELRSALMSARCGARRLMAFSVAGSIWKSRRAANRTARSMRRWSSANRWWGSPMARMTRRFRSSLPPT